eukprot:TRINITY_DN1621_c0_g2_i1.p1 TRINITY_DN1621_c0_g2~~TRINITY_DN1621_c0_g2_i1.p1  ORF type:complete len:251 (+),score=50.93 TRINITY_DN1621_c0_g2_i1:1095-1847(+)
MQRCISLIKKIIIIILITRRIYHYHNYQLTTPQLIIDDVIRIMNKQKHQPFYQNSTLFLILGFLFYTGEIISLIFKITTPSKFLYFNVAQLTFFSISDIILIFYYKPQKYWSKIWNGMEDKVNFLMNIICFVLLSAFNFLSIPADPIPYLLQTLIDLSLWNIAKYFDNVYIFLLAIIHLLFHINVLASAVFYQLLYSKWSVTQVGVVIECFFMLCLLIMVSQSFKDKLIFNLLKEQNTNPLPNISDLKIK